MRLQCHVLLQPKTACNNTKLRPNLASVSVGISQIKKNESVTVIIVTTMKDKKGTKFLLKGNGQIFARFVNEGKVTIEFKEPNIFLYISKADPSQLNLFVKIVRAAISGESLPKLSTAQVAKPRHLEAKKTSIIIKDKKDYPFMEGFPATLEKVEINGCELDRVDPRWMKLRNLTSITFAGNRFGEIPDLWTKLTLSTFTKLVSLSLPNNGLTDLPAAFWNGLPVTLTFMDLSQNSIREIPRFLDRLTRLTHLDLSNNQLECLPYNIGKLSRLRVLKVSNNRIIHFPGSLTWLSLNELDLTGNNPETYKPFSLDEHPALEYPNCGKVASLMEISAKRVLHSKLPLSMLPWDLRLSLILDFPLCVTCRRICLPSLCIFPYDSYSFVSLSRLSATVTSTNGIGRGVKMVGNCCSQKCRRAFGRLQV